MHTDEELIECKTTLKGTKSIRLPLSYLRGLIKEAALQSRGPRVAIEIAEQRWILLPEDDYIELRDK